MRDRPRCGNVIDKGKLIFIQPKKYPVLNSVLSGEGIINDAIAIILFRTISELNLG
jgi:hypothetical protein